MVGSNVTFSINILSFCVKHEIIDDGQLIEESTKISNIPGVIVQGRYDVVCPAYSAWDLHKKWPKAEFHIVPDAGHSMKEEGIQSLLIDACDKFKDL